ncbi:hypothetical protein LguiA_017491 [Lonicera macranthoides]
MDAAGIGGAAIGAVFGSLLEIVKDVAITTYHFKSRLKLIESTLNSLKPKIDSIAQSNIDLNRSDETAMFIDQLKASTKLVRKCSKIQSWDLAWKFIYSMKLKDFQDMLLWFFQVDVQSLLASNSIKTLVEVDDLSDKMDRMLSILDKSSGGDIYGSNTFFVTVSKTANLKDIIQKIFQHKGISPPQFQNIEDSINQLEYLMRRIVQAGSILLVLDDVWSEWESLIEKFNFGIVNYKILVTSRFVFPRFDSYKLNILNYKDAMTLFRHSALRKNDSSKIPEELLNEIVRGCKGFPLALTVVGRSLYGREVVIWKQTLRKWSQGKSIFDSNRDDLLMPLQTSLDALDEKPIAKECYLDLGSFPEDQKIVATVLMDMWVELYGQDEEGMDALENLLELSIRNLVNLLPTRKGTIEVDGYCNEHYVMQHDLLRELAIYRSEQEPIELRKRLIMDISKNRYPQWLVEQQQQPKHARLLSISTDEMFTSSWYNMQLPSTKVLILNFRSKTYFLPHFMEKMDKLKVLIITNYGFCPVELNNFIVLSYLSDLRRIRLENILITFLSKSLLQLKNLQKISLMMCEIGKAFGSCTTEIPQMLPNLLKLEIDYCDDLVEFPIWFCKLLRLKKLSITYCNELSALPDEFGRLVNLEVLRIHSCTKLEQLPESICGLHKLRFLDISDCVGMSKMPERIGDLRGLRALHMRGCRGLQELPPSVNVIKEDINLDWLHNVV